MDENTLSNILYSYVKHTDNYLGIYTKYNIFDLDIMKYRYCSVILFIDNISKNLGHWCVIIKIINNIYFLDSFGLHPKKYGIDLKNIIRSKKHNLFYLTQRSQNDQTTICGGYSIYFIISIIKCKYKITCFINQFKQKFSKTNFQKNYKFIVEYLSKTFPIQVNEKNCVNLFCNSQFIINQQQCLKSLCNISIKAREV